MRTSQKDIAAKAGVDKSTVSLALRDHPSISPATRERIKQIAASLGYRPDPALALIARHRWGNQAGVPTHVLAYVMAPPSASHLTPQLRLVDPAKARAGERGFDLQVFNSGDYPSGEALSRVLFNRGIQGLLLAPLPHSKGPMSLRLDWSKFTTVSCMLGWERPPLHVVEFDWFQAIRRSWAEVLARGYRRIGPAFLGHEPPSENDMACLGAVRAEQARLGRGHKVIPPAVTSPRDRDGFLAWFRKHKPDVVLGFNDLVLEWMEEAGARVPEDVGFVSFTPHREGISGMERRHEHMARAGVDLLVAKLREFEVGIPPIQQTVLIEPKWIEGRTLRPRS
jgi:LacI family transcriptional regulator